MAHQARRESYSGPLAGPVAVTTCSVENDLVWPFGKLDGVDSDDIRETAYEVFFTSCRSSPGFGGKNAITFYSSHDQGGSEGGGMGAPTVARVNGQGVVQMTPTSRVKRALGLKMLRRSPSRRMSSVTSAPTSPGSYGPGHGHGHGGNSPAAQGFSTVPGPSRPRRPLTSAEIMRQQMRVTEQSDNRLRKTLMRTLVGQVRVLYFSEIFKKTMSFCYFMLAIFTYFA